MDVCSRPTVLLTPLSPLSDRNQLCRSPGFDHVAETLRGSGFSVDWDRGLQVDCFNSQQTARPKPRSIVKFTKAGNSWGNNKPASAPCSPKGRSEGNVSDPWCVSTAGKQRCVTPPATPPVTSMYNVSPQQAGQQASTRFNRLAQSVGSLQQLNILPNSHINATNLLALNQPSFKYGNRLGTPSRGSNIPNTWAQSRSLSMPGQAQDVCGEKGGNSPSNIQTTSGNAGFATQQMQQDGMQSSHVAADPGHQQQGVVAHSLQQSQQQQDGSTQDGNTAVHMASSVTATPRPATSCINLEWGGKDTASRPRTGVSLNEGGVSKGRASRAGLMSGFRPTRGHALVVFQHMDKDQNGKITISEMEEVALSLGFTLEQSHKFFQKLDREGKGFLKSNDWGSKESQRLVELFSLSYMQKFMGLPGPCASAEQISKYWQAESLRAVRTMHGAIHMARTNALLRGARAATGTGDVIYEAFSFMDTDGSGKLSYSELRDGFYALGVYIKEEVVQQIIEAFDTDGDGGVNYHEFISKMFPAVKNVR